MVEWNTVLPQSKKLVSNWNQATRYALFFIWTYRQSEISENEQKVYESEKP